MAIFLILTACTKDGETIYQINPDEENPSTAPLVTVIYGPNSLGDRSYCDKIYRGIEASASKRGLRTLHLMPESMEQGLTYLEMMFLQMESAQDTLGSHVGIYNYTNFGNLYTTGPKDFFVKRK